MDGQLKYVEESLNIHLKKSQYKRKSKWGEWGLRGTVS